MKTWQYPEITSCPPVSNPLLAKLLAIRNIDTLEKADIFLNPEKKEFLPFSVFVDSEKVIARIKKAIDESEKILIYGDFDTDGVTSTAIMYKALKEVGADVSYYIPDRDSESHGLNSKSVLTLISKQKVKLIITVDCGISNSTEIKLAKTFKTDVIITDHHEAPEILPEAFAIINPKAQGVLNENVSASDIESLCCLSGAGIAFKLASAICNVAGKPCYSEQLLPIAAFGTIGDVVPLVLENRHIVYSGLYSIRNKVNKGITKLFENAGVKDFSKITSETVAFTGVPRINAVGRLDRADIAFRLFVSDDDAELDDITKILNEKNAERQSLCEEAFERAKNIVEKSPELYKHAVVICDEDAHIGIIGLSASKLVETYAKPAFVMRKDGNNYRCSCRGLQGVNIFNILNENKDLFLGFGGHEFAGGFSFDGSVVSFEKVKEAIDRTVIEQTDGKMLPDVLNIDLKIKAEDASLDLVETVAMLEPFGADNPAPVFSVENLKVSDVKFMGQNKNHLKLFCCDEFGHVLECIKWSVSSFEGEKNDELKIAFCPEKNEFNGKVSVQLMLKDFCLENNKQKSVDAEASYPTKIIDCRTQKGGFDKILDFLEKTKKSVAIFSENPSVGKYFENSAACVFERDEIPQNKDMVILVDTPPSLSFLKNLVDFGTKEILFMSYDLPSESAFAVVSKVAGMMKYVFSSLDGRKNIRDFRKVLGFDDELTIAVLETLQSVGIIDFELLDDGNIIVEKFHSAEKEKIVQSVEFADFEKDYAEFYNHVKAVKNSSLTDLKKYIFE